MTQTHHRNDDAVFHLETLELGKARLRLGCVAIALLKPLFLPLFYINAPAAFQLVLLLYLGIVLICAGSYYLSYQLKNPYPLAIIMLVSTYGLVVVSLHVTGMSNSVFFPLLLMCITGIGLIAPWRLWHSAVVFGAIVALYFGVILLFDRAIDWRRLSIQLMAVGDATLIGTLGIYLLEQVRHKEFKKRIAAFRDREALGRMLHDSLGADLHNIRLLCELTERLPHDSEEARRNIARMSYISKKGLDDIRDFLSIQDRDGIMLYELVNRMRDYGSAVFGDRFRLEEAAPSDGRELSLYQACNLYLLYKEALANIRKHAAADRVAVTMALEEEKLNLSIRDWGKGFAYKPDANGRGVRNMRARADDLGGTVSIHSEAGQGTEVRLSVPMRND